MAGKQALARDTDEKTPARSAERATEAMSAGDNGAKTQAAAAS
jgi:hypothetical protein